MDEVLVKAKDYQEDVAVRAKAHENSAEWHRWRGEVLGNTTTIVSGIVGSAIFLTISSQLGLGKNEFSWPAAGWSLAVAVFVCFLSVLAPVLSGIHGRLNDANQVGTHMVLASDYGRLRRQLDNFLLSYADLSSSLETREEARREFGKISVSIGEVRPSLTLTPKAIARAKKELGH